MIEAIELTKVYPGVEALSDVTLEIKKGSFVGLVGPNGSGKSTFLKLLMGMLRPTSGTVTIDYRKPSWKTRKFTAYVPEIDTLYSWMRVEECIGWYSSYFNDWNKKKAEMLQSVLGIKRFKRVGELSRGFRARLRLFLALSRDAKVFLLDEPLSGIDPASRERIEEAIVKSLEGNETVIFSTHIVKEVEKLFDSVIFLKEGEVFLYKDADELRAEYGKGIEEIFREVYNE